MEGLPGLPRSLSNPAHRRHAIHLQIRNPVTPHQQPSNPRNITILPNDVRVSLISHSQPGYIAQEFQEDIRQKCVHFPHQVHHSVGGHRIQPVLRHQCYLILRQATVQQDHQQRWQHVAAVDYRAVGDPGVRYGGQHTRG